MLADVVKQKQEERQKQIGYEMVMKKMPINVDTLIYYECLSPVGGIETWLYNLNKMYPDNLGFMYRRSDCNIEQLKRLNIPYAKDCGQSVECNTIIFPTVYAMRDALKRGNLKCKRKILVIHCDMNYFTEYDGHIEIPEDVEIYGCSEMAADHASKKFNREVKVLWNPVMVEDETITFLYAGRLSKEKGRHRLEHFIAKAEEYARLNNRKIKVKIFTDLPFDLDKYESVELHEPTLNILPEIKTATYCLLLSDTEGYPYGLLEPLTLGIPVICTKLPALKDLMINETNAKIIDFDMKNLNMEDIFNNIPKFKYTPHESKKLWDSIVIPKQEKLSRERLKNEYKLTIGIPVYNYEGIGKAIESIPKRKDIEIIVVNDGSTDNTLAKLKDYDNIKVITYQENKGTGYARNKILDNAKGEYILMLDADDYIYPEVLKEILDENYKEDMIFYNLQINSGNVWRLNESNIKEVCGQSKMIKRSFIDAIRYPELVYAEDKIFNDKLLKKKPTMVFTNKTLYHYNYPRTGSISDRTLKGEIL